MTAMLRLNGRPSGTRVLTVHAAGDTKVAFEPVALPGRTRARRGHDRHRRARRRRHGALHAHVERRGARAARRARRRRARRDAVHRARARRGPRAVGAAAARARRRPSTRRRCATPRSCCCGIRRCPNGRALRRAPHRGPRAAAALVQLAGRRLGATLVERDAAPRVRRAGSPTAPTTAAARSATCASIIRCSRRSARRPPRSSRRASSATRASSRPTAARSSRGSTTARAADRRAHARAAGRVIVLGMPLDARAGDFPLQPAYLPFVRRLVLYATGRAATPLARATGESWLLPGRGARARRLHARRLDRPAGARQPRDERAAARGRHLRAARRPDARRTRSPQLAVNTPPAESDLADDHGRRASRRRAARRRERDDLRRAPRSRRDRTAAGAVAYRDRGARRAAPARDADGEPRMARRRQSYHDRPVFRRRLMTQADQLLASLAVLRRQWRQTHPARSAGMGRPRRGDRARRGVRDQPRSCRPPARGSSTIRVVAYGAHRRHADPLPRACRWRGARATSGSRSTSRSARRS